MTSNVVFALPSLPHARELVSSPGTMLRYGYQLAHKIALALPPYAAVNLFGREGKGDSLAENGFLRDRCLRASP